MRLKPYGEPNVKNYFLVVSGLTVLFLAGCQTMPYQGKARDVKRRQGQGGVIAMSLDPRPEDRQVAEQKMQSTCGNIPYQVLEEGEVAIGTKSVQNDRATLRDDTRKKQGKFLGMDLVTGEAGGVNTTTESTTETVKEWQITYECVAAKKAVR
jgi:hypothetical protein